MLNEGWKEGDFIYSIDFLELVFRIAIVTLCGREHLIVHRWTATHRTWQNWRCSRRRNAMPWCVVNPSWTFYFNDSHILHNFIFLTWTMLRLRLYENILLFLWIQANVHLPILITNGTNEGHSSRVEMHKQTHSDVSCQAPRSGYPSTWRCVPAASLTSSLLLFCPAWCWCVFISNWKFHLHKYFYKTVILFSWFLYETGLMFYDFQCTGESSGRRIIVVKLNTLHILVWT